jgi:chromate transporter
VDAGQLALHLPDLATLRPVPLGIATLAAVLVLVLRWPVLRVLGISAAFGLTCGLAGLRA